MMTRKSLIEWATEWVPETSPFGEPGQRKRFAEALASELKDWRPPEAKPIFCKNCPFAQHIHYEENGKMVAPGCSGFEPDGLGLVDDV